MSISRRIVKGVIYNEDVDPQFEFELEDPIGEDEGQVLCFPPVVISDYGVEIVEEPIP